MSRPPVHHQHAPDLVCSDRRTRTLALPSVDLPSPVLWLDPASVTVRRPTTIVEEPSLAMIGKIRRLTRIPDIPWHSGRSISLLSAASCLLPALLCTFFDGHTGQIFSADLLCVAAELVARRPSLRPGVGRHNSTST